MVAELPTIPQRHLLTALLELNADLPAVAARTRTPLDELTRWAHTDAVHAWLAAYRYFSNFAREHHELARVTRSLDDLEKVARSTQDPIEKRRILTAILHTSTAILSNRVLRADPILRGGRAGEALANDPCPQPSHLHAPASTTAAPHHPRTPPRASKPFLENATPAVSPAPSTSTVTPSVPSVPSVPPDLSDLLPILRPPDKRKSVPAHLLAAAGLPAP